MMMHNNLNLLMWRNLYEQGEIPMEGEAILVEYLMRNYNSQPVARALERNLKSII